MPQLRGKRYNFAPASVSPSPETEYSAITQSSNTTASDSAPDDEDGSDGGYSASTQSHITVAMDPLSDEGEITDDDHSTSTQSYNGASTESTDPVFRDEAAALPLAAQASAAAVAPPLSLAQPAQQTTSLGHDPMLREYMRILQPNPATANPSMPIPTSSARTTSTASPSHVPFSELFRSSPIPVRDMVSFVRRSRSDRMQEVQNARRPRTAPLRPWNSFILYRAAFSDRIKAWCRDNSNQTVSRLSAASWKLEPPIVRDLFQTLADMDKHHHALAFPGYKYQPRKNGVDVVERGKGKRRREDSDEDSGEESAVDNDSDGEYRPRRSKRARVARVVYAEPSSTDDDDSEDEVRPGPREVDAAQPTQMRLPHYETPPYEMAPVTPPQWVDMPAMPWMPQEDQWYHQEFPVSLVGDYNWVYPAPDAALSRPWAPDTAPMPSLMVTPAPGDWVDQVQVIDPRLLQLGDHDTWNI